MIKENYVYQFSYNTKAYKERSYPNHCFDGQLLAVKYPKGILLKDTYWGFGDSSSRSFTISNAKKEGTLTFICDISKVDKIEKYDSNYYDDKDIFNLSHQHGCYPLFYKKKGAKRSKKKMIEVVKMSIENLEHKIGFDKNSLVRQLEDLKKIENGDTSIYINAVER